MGLRGPKAKGQFDWMVPVAELMVQEHMSFSAACQALGKTFDNSAAERAAQYAEAFQNILDALNYKLHARTGDNPFLTKGFIKGVLVTAIRRLGESEQWDKVAIPAKLIADMEGWNKTDAAAPVLLNLTQKEIDDLKAKYAEQLAQESDGTKPTRAN